MEIEINKIAIRIYYYSQIYIMGLHENKAPRFTSTRCGVINYIVIAHSVNKIERDFIERRCDQLSFREENYELIIYNLVQPMTVTLF